MPFLIEGYILHSVANILAKYLRLIDHFLCYYSAIESPQTTASHNNFYNFFISFIVVCLRCLEYHFLSFVVYVFLSEKKVFVPRLKRKDIGKTTAPSHSDRCQEY